MKASWVIYTYPYGFQSVAPTSADNDYPLGYIWILNNLGIAYSLSSISDSGSATWVAKPPDTIYNQGTGFQVNVIGNASLVNVTTGSQQVTLPDNVIISNPVPAGYKVTNIRLNAEKKIVITYEDSPVS